MNYARILFVVGILSLLTPLFFSQPLYASNALALPCSTPAVGETDITREGTVFASTIFDGFPKELSVDCDTATSWFSTGPEPGGVPTIYRWTGARDDLITTIHIISNHDHPQFPTNFGFGSVTVLVRDAANQIVFQQENIPLPGTPDPDIVLHPNVVGRVVELLFSGHEADNCGGIAELQIFANRTPPTNTPPPPPTQVPPTVVPPTKIPPTVAPLPPPPTATNIPSPAAPGAILASDDFNAPNGTLCAWNTLNNALGGNLKLFYLPIFPTGGTDASKPLGANIASGALENNGLDYGGFQFALSDACAAPRGSVRGADLGQDINFRADLFVPTNAAGLITQAGPYFRSRAAASGDGIIGGESAGYWVQLESTGEIKIKRLNPQAIIAFSGKPALFDANALHQIEIAASADKLQVALDGKLQTFNQDGQCVTVTNIPATGGANNGTAGIAFGAEPNRGQIGGQRADNVVLRAYQPLDLAIEDNCATAQATTIPTTDSGQPTAVQPTTDNRLPTTVALATPPPGALLGDCDGDAKISELDALCALEMSVRVRAILLVMDMDGDGNVTSRDAVIVLQKAVGQ